MVQWPQRLVVASLWVLIIENRIFWLLSWRITFPTILQVVFRLFHLISIISHFLSGQGLAIESGHSNISCRHSWRNPIARLLSVYNYLMDGRVINNISRRDNFNSSEFLVQQHPQAPTLLMCHKYILNSNPNVTSISISVLGPL